MSLRAIGECVDFVERPWSMDGRSGVTRKIRVQTNRKTILELKVAEGVTAPYDGQAVDLLVEPRISQGEGRNASSSLTVVGHHVPDEGSSGRRASAAASAA